MIRPQTPTGSWTTRLTTSGAAGVDDSAGVLAGDAPVVPEHTDHVVDVVLALDEALAGVQRLRSGHGVLVALEQVGHAQQQVAALAGAGAGPGSVVEGARCRTDGG